MKLRKLAYDISGHILLCGLSLLFFIPFFWLVCTSLKPDKEIFSSTLKILPTEYKWSNYREAIEFIPILRYLGNTLLICFFNVIGAVLSCSLVAYGFSRIKWKGRNTFFIILLSTMMLSGQVTMIPVFRIFRTLGWIGTFLPLIVPSFFGSAFFIFLLRQFFMGIPKALSEAAIIDGCSEFGIYLRIILPLSKPALLTVGLFTFLGMWNDFMGPLIYLTDNSKYTLAVGLQQFLGQYSAEWSKLMAISTLMTIPVIILFFLTQKTFVKGIALTGLKG
jgi:ABC-type glycerol-3-phosphate transport system permease component